ncbi:MAG: DUF1801 domain-containing protein [Spirochaetales bacterium]|jgi:uncharacterized protein YdhG (YjbR/CyaY superfamily)|nr:DUF1801 domain-containing protein [Spirochaetales bacterium]
MQSEAIDVDSYLREVPKDRLSALSEIRNLCRESHPGYTENMAYGMPSYSKGGVVELAFASQKQNIALYVLKEGVVNQFRDRFAKSAIGKGCIRFRNPEKIDFELVRQILDDAYRSVEPPC